MARKPIRCEVKLQGAVLAPWTGDRSFGEFKLAHYPVPGSLVRGRSVYRLQSEHERHSFKLKIPAAGCDGIERLRELMDQGTPIAVTPSREQEHAGRRGESRNDATMTSADRAS